MWRSIGLILLTAALAYPAGELSNRRAPGFSLPDSDFDQHDLYDYRGKVVVLVFMRTECPHCKTFSTILEEAEEHYSGGVKVLSVVHPPDSQPKVQQYLAENDLSTTMLFDSGQVAASYFKLTPASPSFSTPHFFVIDQEGMIREDYGYEPLSRRVFEGDALYSILDRYVAPIEIAAAD